MVESLIIYRLINKPIQKIRSLYRKDIFNTFERKKFVLKFLPDNPVIIDAGANDGSDSIEFAELCPTGKIAGFEPMLTLYKNCLENTKKNTSIAVYNLAIGDKNEELFIKSIKGFPDSSSLCNPITEKNSIFQNQLVTEIPIQVVRLDDWAFSHQIDKIDFLWLDLQGYELKALEGMGEMIQKVTAVYLEVMFKPIYLNQPLYPDVQKFMKDKGFKLVRKYFYYGDHGDALYVRKGWQKK